jgi:hypothetical protein
MGQAKGPRTNRKRIVQRHIFRSMPDGMYRLFDANGQYSPVSGSGWSMYFAMPRYLTHTLNVGQGASVDFMDFAIYPYCSTSAYTDSYR